MNSLECVCGKTGSLKCIFGVCKRCCISNFCFHHNAHNVCVNNTICIICEKQKEDMIKFDSLSFYCNECYVNHKNIIDNKYNKLNNDDKIEDVYIENIKYDENKEKNKEKNNDFNNINVYDVDRCICVKNLCSQECIVKCCKNCCKFKGCEKHSKKYKYKSENICDICSLCQKHKNYKMNKYFHKYNERVIHYCNECYNNNSENIDRLLHHNYEEQMSDFSKFLQKYNGTILTSEIYFDEIFKRDDYSLREIGMIDYLCPICNAVDIFRFMTRCGKCGVFHCDDCTNKEEYGCEIENCEDCKKGYCYRNNKCDVYCDNCSVNDSDNDDIFRKYFSRNCSICNNMTNLFSLHKCDDCSENICENCCYQSTYKNTVFYSCSKCHQNYNDSKIKSTSPCVISTNDETQCDVCLTYEKKYACVPCGHLCMCGMCANKINDNCPICKCVLTNVIKIYS